MLPAFWFEGVEFGFALSHNRKRSIPAPLKFACHEPIVGIDGVILALRMGRFIACLFKRELNLTLLLSALRPGRLDRPNSRFDAQGLKPLQDFGADGFIDAQRSEADARIGAMVEERATTVIAPDLAVSARISDVQFAAAMAAAQKAAQQQLAAARRTACHHALTVGVVCNQALIPFEVCPAQVTLVMVDEQDLSVRSLLAQAPHDTFAAIFDGDPAAGPAKGIGTGVNRVGKNVMHGVVDG